MRKKPSDGPRTPCPQGGTLRSKARGARPEDIEDLKTRLAEAEGALRAIREGEVDAIIVSGSKGERVFSLSESEGIYRLMVETMSEAGLAVTPDGTVLFSNNCLVNMLRTPLEKVIGQPLARFVAPSSRRRLSSLLAKARVGPADALLVLVASDGATIPVHAWANLLERPEGPTVCLVGVDLTQLETSKEVIQHLQEQRKALAESERHYRSLFDAMTEGFALLEIWDERGAPDDYRFLEINPAFERLTLLKREEVIGKPVSRIPQFSPAWLKKYSEVALTGRPSRFEEYWPARKRHLDVYAYRPAPRQFAVFFLDITERKKAEREQKLLNDLVSRQKEQLSALVNSINDEIWFADTEGTFTLINPAAEREFSIGNLAPNIKALSERLEILRPDGSLRPLEEAPPLRALRGEIVNAQEEIVRTPATGVLRHRVCSSSPVRDSGGRIIGAVSVVRDVTEKVRNEKALRESHALLETVFSSMNEALVVLDTNGRIIRFNDAFVSFCRFRSREECLRTIDEFAPFIKASTLEGSPLPVEEWPAARALRGEAAANVDFLIERTDTGETWIANTSFSPLFDKGGEIIGAVQSLRDVTALKKAEQVLLRSREELEELVRRRTEEIKGRDDIIRRTQKIEALGTLAGGIAHDFNNILQTITINTELSLLDADGSGFNQESLQFVIKAAQRGRDLVKQIITFSSQREQDRRPIRIEPVIKDAMKLIRTSMPASIEVHDDIDASAGVVLADPSQIHQFLMNLCVNAEHAMRERGGLLGVAVKSVEVNAALASEHPELRVGPYVQLVVRDTGCGMTAEVMDRIFDPSFTTKQSNGGSGLGLSVVHGIVKSYGGAIMVSSEPGLGSTFTILLPRSQQAQEPPRSREDVVCGAGERILLVEDEAAQLQSVTALLERLGYAVTARQDSTEALAAFEAAPHDFDVIITDQTMPKMSGSQLAEAAFRIRSGIPIILCTGFSHVVGAERAKLIGIREYIFKPFSLSDISAMLRRVLADPKRG